MIQKTTWTHYLIIGISFYITLFFNSCSETIEYRFDADIIYKNETIHTIKYFELINSQQRLLFELAPSSVKKIEIRGSGGNDNQNIDNCCQGILADFQGNNSILIDYDNNDKCLIYVDGLGSTTGNISAYESREIESRYYEFTYTFTEDEYNQAGDCN